MVLGFVRDKGEVTVVLPRLGVDFFISRNLELSASAEAAGIEILFCLSLGRFTELIPQTLFDVALQGHKICSEAFFIFSDPFAVQIKVQV